jgi:[acyl-carrier-protein] S-malonyltransferase
MSFEDALEVVTLRGRAMQDAAEASAGSMVALMGADETQAQALCEQAAHDGVLVPANFNAPGQIVLSGDAGACDRAAELAAEQGFRATPLTVAGAFHSPHMAPAAERLAAALEKVTMHEPRCVVMANVTGEPHEADAASIRERLVEQLTQPVRWDRCGRWLADHAAGEYHELAPGKVLSGLMRRIERSVRPTPHDEPDESLSAGSPSGKGASS